MIKRVFVGVLLAAIFILLILGAVNRTLAKLNDPSPLSLQEEALENDATKQSTNQGLQLTNTIREDYVSQIDWVDLSGQLEAMESNLWVITLTDGSPIELEGHPLSFVIEQGFTAEIGDPIAMRGYYDDAYFKLGTIVNQSTGQEITLRDETGHPLWSGGNRENN